MVSQWSDLRPSSPRVFHWLPAPGASPSLQKCLGSGASATISGSRHPLGTSFQPVGPPGLASPLAAPRRWLWDRSAGTH